MEEFSSVSCDSCNKSSFSGCRYKCLRCCDYDLCSVCFEAGLATAQHKVDHAMQCLLTRKEVELFFGGEESGNGTSHQSFTCPYCGCLGLTEVSLQEHLDEDHPDDTQEVVCPVCAASPGGDPNHMTEDLLTHLTVEHRIPRTAVYEDTRGDSAQSTSRPAETGGPSTERHTVTLATSRAATRHQLRRADVLINDSASSSGSGREFEAVDPVSELLSQLTNARNRAQAVRNVSAQLHQLELQLQSTRQQLEGLPLRAVLPTGAPTLRQFASSAQKLVVLSNSQTTAASVTSTANTPSGSGDNGSLIQATANARSPFLLSRCCEGDISELEQQERESTQICRSHFVQELLLSISSLATASGEDSLELIAARSYANVTVNSGEVDQWHGSLGSLSPSASSNADMPNCGESRNESYDEMIHEDVAPDGIPDGAMVHTATAIPGDTVKDVSDDGMRNGADGDLSVSWIVPNRLVVTREVLK